MSEKEFKKKVEKDPYFKDAKDILCQDTEICSAVGQPISKILESLKYCEKKRTFSDRELLENVPENVEPINSQEIYNYSSSEDDEYEYERPAKRSRNARKGGKNKKTRKQFSKLKI